MRKSTLAAGLVVALACGASAADVEAQPPVTTLEFRNELPAAYQLDRVQAWIDGVQVYDGPRPFDVPVPPGQHLVTIVADYRLRDPVFTYMQAYRIELTSRQLVRAATHDHPDVARALAVESGGPTTPIQRRAEIVWR